MGGGWISGEDSSDLDVEANDEDGKGGKLQLGLQEASRHSFTCLSISCG